MLFVRFNQADHAQEHLQWYAERDSRESACNAREEIEYVYAQIDEAIMVIARTVGEGGSFRALSDHGIDYVEHHVRPNSVLRDLVLDRDFVFSGDSTLCYLYGDRPLTVAERDDLARCLEHASLGIGALPEARAVFLRLPVGRPRIGQMIIGTGRHTKFQYDDGPFVLEVAAASHGHGPPRGGAASRGFVKVLGADWASRQRHYDMAEIRGIHSVLIAASV